MQLTELETDGEDSDLRFKASNFSLSGEKVLRETEVALQSSDVIL
jgi:hypothetical protein